MGKLETREADWQAGELDDAYVQERVLTMQIAIEKKMLMALPKETQEKDATLKEATSAAQSTASKELAEKKEKELAEKKEQLGKELADKKELAEKQAKLLAEIGKHPLFPKVDGL